MNNIIEQFKTGLSQMTGRPFGEKFAEYLIKHMYNMQDRTCVNHDLNLNNNRIEVKFARLLKQVPFEGNNFNYILDFYKRTFKNSTDVFEASFQKLNFDSFDVLYYGMAFDDTIKIYKANKEDIINFPSFRNQHKDNKTIKQFSIKQSTIDFHKTCLIAELEWEHLFELFEVWNNNNNNNNNN